MDPISKTALVRAAHRDISLTPRKVEFTTVLSDSSWRQGVLYSVASCPSEAGCAVLVHGEYDVGYRFLDVESFVFWLKAVPMSFDPDRDWRQAREVVARYSSPRGIETNEHRELLIVRKQ